MEASFRKGHEVGRIAQELYGNPQSVEIAFDFKTMVAETRRLIDAGASFPIFEASFRFENILVRADIMLPGDNGWHLVEVKASTSVKDYHVIDCAIQDWIIRNSGINVLSVSIAYVNKQFVYAGDGNYVGLLLEEDLTDDVRAMEPRVVELVDAARATLLNAMPRVAVGAQCNKPYDCQFIAHCWPSGAEYPVAGLGGSKAKLGQWIEAGCQDIRDVNFADITAETQQRIHRVTASGKPELLPGASDALRVLPYPRYYLDFETIGPAVPIWPGTRPYATVPVQWSCHIETADGEIAHEEFLELSGDPPMRALTEQMIRCLGESGPIFMYTNYEKRVIRWMIDAFPDLSEALSAILERLFDLMPVVKTHYYHPKMLGSWSIKSVIPCITPGMDYAGLDGISEGTGASEGFLEAISPDTEDERKRELEKQLLRYCRFDTEAMVEIVRFLSKT
jgi:hypothetical protein